MRGSARSSRSVVFLQDGMPAGAQVERDDARWMIGRAGAEHDAIAVGAHRAELGERRLERTQVSAGQVQHREPAEPRLRIGADDPIGSGERIGRGAERPLRQPELRLHRRQWLRRARCALVAIEIPPAGAIRHEYDLRCRRATTRAGRSIPTLRRRSPAARRWRRQRSPQRGRAWCRSTACWDDPRRARPASCRRATAAAS